MFKNILIATMLCLFSLAASAEAFRTVTRAYEVRLSDFQAPASYNSSIGVRGCKQCDEKSMRVTTATRYTINDELVDLKEFRRQLLQVRDRDSKAVTVMYHLESETVTAVAVTLQDAG